MNIDLLVKVNSMPFAFLFKCFFQWKRKQNTCSQIRSYIWFWEEGITFSHHLISSPFQIYVFGQRQVYLLIVLVITDINSSNVYFSTRRRGKVSINICEN